MAMGRPRKPCDHTPLVLDGCGRCVECRGAYQRAYRANNAARLKAAKTVYYQKNRASILAKVKDYARRNEHVVRASRGQPMPARPEPEACEACGAQESLHLDHCHASGAFRGWLCRRCNTTIGAAGDTLAALRKWSDSAQEYLLRAVTQ
jgi:Recombination endonuclease VII